MTKKDWVEKIKNHYEDGTGERLSEVLEQHPVEDVEDIKRAFDEINSFIGMMMSCTVDYWHKGKNKYISVFGRKNDPEIEWDKWEMCMLFDKRKFYPEDAPEDHYYGPLLAMYKEYHRVQHGERSEAEQQRVEQYGMGYRYLFSRLLDGYSYQKNKTA